MAVAYASAVLPVVRVDAEGDRGPMNSESSAPEWFAVQVRARWERSTSTLLSGKGYETLLPLYKAQRRWSGRVKEISSPLFPGYVFCRFDVLKRLPILVTPGVISLLGRGRVPIPVEAAEISAIQTLVSSGLPVEPWPYLEVGQKVRIEDHALHGVEGILIGFRGSRRIVVSVTLLRRSVALEIERARVSPVRPSRNADAGSLSSQPLLGRVTA